MPNHPANTNYLGPPTPKRAPPPQWALGPPPGNEVNPLAVGLPTADHLEDGAQPWTTSPLSMSMEMETIIITTTTMLDPCPELKTPRTILTMHWLGKENLTSKSLNLSLAMTPGTKPITFQLESSQVAFTASYLQGISFDHYMALLQFDPNNSISSNRLAFIQEFSGKFGIFDTVVEAEENLFNLQMHNNKCFMTFIIQFEWEAYKT
ncbi:hypothetical protein C0989_002059, partial [Termitomyces sp. Mn162]